MERTRRLLSVFSIAFLILGVTGINTTGAVTKTKLTAPGVPTDVKAVGGINRATVSWKAPASNGGVGILWYRVTYYPGAVSYNCKGSVFSCIITIPNPNKASAKPKPVSYYFTVAAINSIGSSPASARSATVAVNFTGTVYVAPKSGPSTPTPTPTPLIKPIPSPTADSSPTFLPPYVTNAFDGTYTGFATVTTKSGFSTNDNTSTIPTSFVVYAGRGTGRALNWSVDGYITDPAGRAEVSVADALYGSLTFFVSFTQDPVTREISGNGKGTKTFTVPGYGQVTVEFVFSVTNKK